MDKINYLGKGKLPCPECHGEKTVKCKKCSGHGKISNCNNCNSTGKVICPDCGGSGQEISVCPVCDHGKVKKTRWINCKECHGTGNVARGGGYDCGICGEYAANNLFRCSCGAKKWVPRLVTCQECDGRGQVEETYYEFCPNCHGEYKRKTDNPCKKCDGTGKVKCSRCGGTGHAECQTCGGSGKVECEKCSGEGSIFDSSISLKSMKDAASDGNLFALHDLACAYILGTDGLNIDCDKAKECFEKILKCGASDEEDEIVVESAEVYLKSLPGICNGDVNLMRELATTFGDWEASVMIEDCAPNEFWLKKASEVEARQKTQKKEVHDREAREIDKQRREAEIRERETEIRVESKRKNNDLRTKKRWKFVVLGILFGFFGIHLAYAKRWLLFLLLWAGFITGNVMTPTKSAIEENSSETVARQVEQADKAKSEGGSPIGGIGFGVWALLWIGGTLFIKKDGKGNRM